MVPDKPWLDFYGDVPDTIDYPEITMYEALLRTVARCPEAVAFDFFGTTATYRKFAEAIDRCADALASSGLKANDRMTIAMPTCPQAVICFYAVNKLGAVASMIHPPDAPGRPGVAAHRRHRHHGWGRFFLLSPEGKAQLYKHPDVLEACVIGVPDATQVERVKAFVVLKNPDQAGPELEKTLIEFCRQDLIVWSCPREIEFRTELPLTLLGKVAFAELVAEELTKQGDEADVCRK